MRVSVRLFAMARQLAGSPSVVLQLDDGATVGELKRVLIEAHPALIPLLPRLMFAVDAEYASDDLVIAPGAEIAVIPPVSGGSHASRVVKGRS